MDHPVRLSEDRLAWLRLTLVPGVSHASRRILLEAFGSAPSVLAAPTQALASLVGDGVACLVKQGPAPALLDATLSWLARPACRMLVASDAHYPQALRDIYDPPHVLYVQGRVELLSGPCLAIVGSRNATPQGLRDSESLARALSDAGLAIASGLALGIDAAAHRGGLAGAASTIAVMGTGPDRIYPSGNRDLAHAIATQGCLVSEFAVGTAPIAWNFPRRNRLISGLSRGVLVVEAALKSGSLDTARSALDQGRDVFAVPGSIHSPLSKGCHSLLKQGATLVECADDVLGALGLAACANAPEWSENPVVEEDPVLEEMGHTPATIDQLAQRTKLDAAKLAAHLSRLEVSGRVRAMPGGWFQRVATRVIE